MRICVDLPGSRLHGVGVKYPLRRPYQHSRYPLDVIGHVPPSQELVNQEEKGMHCRGWNTPRLQPASSTGRSLFTCGLTLTVDRGKLRPWWQPVDWQSHTAASYRTPRAPAVPNLLDRSVTINPLIKLIAVYFVVYLIIMNQLIMLVIASFMAYLILL